MPETPGWIFHFDDADLSPAEWTELAGGKGANLMRLVQAGLPVPDGFILKTTAYSEFLFTNHLEERILASLPAKIEADPEELEAASCIIRGMFQEGRIPAAVESEIKAAYRSLGEPPVAVRSSATAEDTVELSFAGQQDTYLNVTGSDAVVKAVIDCWGSLWTARAIGYRARNRVSHAHLALAVVVQRMVPSQISGVLFTANPLTGLRSEAVIDAAYGLGEALVSGKVEPDQYIVDTVEQKVVKVTLGAKAVRLRSHEGGGTVWEEVSNGAQQALTNAQILSLTLLGSQVQALFSAPQDIEWALAGDRLFLLQSRPVTSLYPIPAGLSAQPLKVMVSFAAVQGLMAPITPLGRDTFRWLFAVGGGLFGMNITAENQTVLLEAGERLWINITTLLRNSVGRKVAAGALGFVEPSVQQALREILDDPRLLPEHSGLSWKARKEIAHFAIPLAGNLLLNLMAPAARRKAIVGGGEKLLVKMQQQMEAIGGSGRERLKKVSTLLPRFTIEQLPFTFLRFVSGVAAGMASLNALNRLASTLPAVEGQDQELLRQNLVLELTRAMPDNPTTEMDMALWRVAHAIQKSPELLAYFQRHSSGELGQAWSDGTLDSQAAQLIGDFLARYGSRGLAEIDLGRIRWREDPTPVFSALEGYLQIQDPDQAPDAVFERGEGFARASLNHLSSSLRRTRGGWIKAPLARFFAHRMRALLCMRESPKFFAVRIFSLIRSELLRCAQDMILAGELENQDDLFFLTYKELEEFSSSSEIKPWQEIISGRRRSFDMEQHRSLIPRMLLSDGRAFYEGIQAVDGAENVITGSPVSPGSAEGLVRVVLNPHQANLKPGEIMVCPGTDPSWTPLFLTARGLIMEVGGMMTHGAVVAREYGIPAVVGVDRATLRLKTGTRIRLDGSSGMILVLEES